MRSTRRPPHARPACGDDDTGASAGWAIASTSPLRIQGFVFNLFVIPDLPLRRSQAAEDIWSQVHGLLAYGAGLLALAHALVALHHHVWRQDGTLIRIVRPDG